MERSYALVTGADHGVGFALTKELLNRNYQVIACRLNPKETAIDDLGRENPDLIGILTLDIGSDQRVALSLSSSHFNGSIIFSM